MIRLRTVLYTGLLATTLGLGACNMMPMMSHSSAVTARLSGASEVPPTSSAASGMLEASMNKDTNVLSWTVSYSGLTGPATGGHFHGPAMAGQNAGVVLPFAGSLASPIKGTATLTAAQAGDLMAGKWYVNLHTAASPGGEIRGQVSVGP